MTLKFVSGSPTTTEASDTSTQFPDSTTTVGSQQTSTQPIETTTDKVTEETTSGSNQETTTASAETTNSPAETTTSPVETTKSPEETTAAPVETTNPQTTDSNSETTTQSVPTTTDSNGEETTTNALTTSGPPSNGNSSCPPLEEGQAHFVCPTGFRRHPQDCGLFYQCTQSPETSHLSIVTFNCPNGTIYDEEAIQCRDRKSNDNCASKSQNATLLRGTVFDFEHESSAIVRKLQSFVTLTNFHKNLFSDPNQNKTFVMFFHWAFPVRRERNLLINIPSM